MKEAKRKDRYEMMKQHSLSQTVGRIFVEAEKRYPLLEFAYLFINTDLFGIYFEDYTIFSQSRRYVLQLFEEELAKKNQPITRTGQTQCDSDVAYWMGYLLSEWSQGHGLDMSLVTREHLQWLYNNYDVLHTQSVEYVNCEYTEEILELETK